MKDPQCSVRETLLVRQWYILGRMLGRMLQGATGVSPKAIGGLAPDSAFADPKSLLNFYLAHSRVEDPRHELADLDQDQIGKGGKYRPLSGIRTSGARMVSMHEHEMARAFVYLAARKGYTREPGEPFPADVPIQEVTRTYEDIAKRGRDLDIRLSARPGVEVPLLRWLTECRRLFVQAKSDALAQKQLDQSLVSEFRRIFWQEFPKRIQLLRFLIVSGRYQLRDGATAVANALKSKRAFLPQSADGYGNVGYAEEAGEWARWADNALIEYGLPCRGPSASREEDQRMPEPRDVRKVAEEAVRWLRKRGCREDEGILVAGGTALLEYALEQDRDWVANWKEPLEYEGFGGRFRGFLCWTQTYLPGAHLLAIDLRTPDILAVRPELLEDPAKWGELGVTCEFKAAERQRLQESIQKREPEQRVDHFCKVVATFYWELDGEHIRRNTRAFEIRKRREPGDRAQPGGEETNGPPLSGKTQDNS